MSATEARYELTVCFYEFRNPLGLYSVVHVMRLVDCNQPAACDDVQQKENCTTIAPRTCDTRIRFLVRPFEYPVNTAPNTGYRHFTPSNGGNILKYLKKVLVGFLV